VCSLIPFVFLQVLQQNACASEITSKAPPTRSVGCRPTSSGRTSLGVVSRSQTICSSGTCGPTWTRASTELNVGTGSARSVMSKLWKMNLHFLFRNQGCRCVRERESVCVLVRFHVVALSSCAAPLVPLAPVWGTNGGITCAVLGLCRPFQLASGWVRAAIFLLLILKFWSSGPPPTFLPL
jgi:hypothetical protein